MPLSEIARPAISLPLVLTVVAWSFNFIALKLVYPEIPPAVVGLSRWFLMLTGLYVLCAFARVTPKVCPRSLPLVLLQGFLSLGVYMVLFLEGTLRTGAAEAAIVLSTAPVLTAVFAAVAGQERLRPAVLGWAAVAFGGVVLVVLGGGQPTAPNGGRLPEKLLGDTLVFGSSVVWAISAVMSRPLVGKHPPLAMLTVSMYGALPALLVYGISPTAALAWGEVSPKAWWLLVYIALGAGVLGFAGFYAGVRQVGAPGAMLYQYCVAPLATLLQWIVLGVPMALLQLVGLVVVFVGVAMSTKSRRSVAMRPPAEALDGA